MRIIITSGPNSCYHVTVLWSPHVITKEKNSKTFCGTSSKNLHHLWTVHVEPQQLMLLKLCDGKHVKCSCDKCWFLALIYLKKCDERGIVIDGPCDEVPSVIFVKQMCERNGKRSKKYSLFTVNPLTYL